MGSKEFALTIMHPLLMVCSDKTTSECLKTATLRAIREAVKEEFKVDNTFVVDAIILHLQKCFL